MVTALVLSMSLTISGGSKGGLQAPQKFPWSPLLAPTFLERYETLTFEYVVYCKYSRIRKIYKK